MVSFSPVSNRNMPKLLTREEEAELVARWKNSDQKAGNRIIEAFRPYVRKKIQEIKKRFPSLPQEDIQQIVHIGFVQGMHKFNPDRGRLTTICELTIEGALRSQAPGYSENFISSREGLKIIRAVREEADASLTRCEGATLPEIWARVSVQKNVPVERIKKIWSSLFSYVPLNQPVGQTGLLLEETLASDDPHAVDTLNEQRWFEAVHKAIERLEKQNPRQADILKRRFGFGENGAETLEQVIANRGETVSRQAVDSVCLNAIKKIRQFLIEQGLKDLQGEDPPPLRSRKGEQHSGRHRRLDL